MTSSWFENNLDLSTKFNVGKNAASLLSLNYFSFQERIDQNKDNFTDTTLQSRISVFNKWNFKRKENRQASFALRYLYEDRFGEKCNGINLSVAVTKYMEKVSIPTEQRFSDCTNGR